MPKIETKLENTNPIQGSSFIPSPYGFTSREWDQETGDYYYRARNYDPRSGRFLSEDPIGFRSGDTNDYRYVFNNPLKYTDPEGKVASAPALLVCGAVLYGAAVIVTNHTASKSCQEKGEDKKTCDDKASKNNLLQNIFESLE